MEFRFDLSQLFRHPIVKINNSMLPSGFSADRRTALEATARVSEIINEIGETSATSQGLSVPVTSADKLRRSDHTLYVLNEKNDKRGLVVGFLKIGKKSLYLFNEQGKTVYVTAFCLLDFWIHESRQRQGWGRKLFQYMIEQENLLPHEIAYDRPSTKLLNFLAKHFGLYSKIQQLNNFVIFDGFFDNKNDLENVDRRMRITASNDYREYLSELSPRAGDVRGYVEDVVDYHRQDLVDDDLARQVAEMELRQQHEYQSAQSSRPPSLPQSPSRAPSTRTDSPVKVAPPQHISFADASPASRNGHSPSPLTPQNPNYPHNKMHTGMKNISSNVLLAVSPSSRMEFDQEKNEGFGSVKINRPIRNSYDRHDTDSLTSDSSRMTEKGHHDLKFYHNKLW